MRIHTNGSSWKGIPQDLSGISSSTIWKYGVTGPIPRRNKRELNLRRRKAIPSHHYTQSSNQKMFRRRRRYHRSQKNIPRNRAHASKQSNGPTTETGPINVDGITAENYSTATEFQWRRSIAPTWGKEVAHNLTGSSLYLIIGTFCFHNSHLLIPWRETRSTLHLVIAPPSRYFMHIRSSMHYCRPPPDQTVSRKIINK